MHACAEALGNRERTFVSPRLTLGPGSAHRTIASPGQLRPPAASFPQVVRRGSSSTRPPGRGGGVGSHPARESSLFSRGRPHVGFYTRKSIKSTSIFEMARRRPRSSGEQREHGITSTMQRDFYIGFMYIFLLAELLSRRILEIIFCIFSMRCREGPRATPPPPPPPALPPGGLSRKQ